MIFICHASSDFGFAPLPFAYSDTPPLSRRSGQTRAARRVPSRLKQPIYGNPPETQRTPSALSRFVSDLFHKDCRSLWSLPRMRGASLPLVEWKRPKGTVKLLQLFRCLSCSDGYIPGLQARRRGYKQGRVNIRQFSNRGWRQVVAVFFPVPMEFFHPRLQALPLFIR